ncbi:MAG: hypothetical protein M1831_000835 [Alyxoria varia]|nr:MAG: hypothetical protein M1831_000835 [Alyxoria varia]
MIATISYGVRCIPFVAVYKDVPGAKCFSQHILVVTMQVNAILACLIDVVTALIPEFLLWKVQMKRKTKIILNVIFGLGLLTSGLSIGRAASSNGGIFQTDNTWRVMPTNMWGLVEEKCGIIFASGPAIRQFIGYVRRVGTAYPTSARQAPGADFTGMRYRITLRDLFWYRRNPSGTCVTEPQSYYSGSKSPPRLPDVSETGAETSRLDVEETKAKRWLTLGLPSLMGTPRWFRRTRQRSEDHETLRAASAAEAASSATFEKGESQYGTVQQLSTGSQASGPRVLRAIG